MERYCSSLAVLKLEFVEYQLPKNITLTKVVLFPTKGAFLWRDLDQDQ